jgi:hypothetical protein
MSNAYYRLATVFIHESRFGDSDAWRPLPSLAHLELDCCSILYSDVVRVLYQLELFLDSLIAPVRDEAGGGEGERRY